MRIIIQFFRDHEPHVFDCGRRCYRAGRWRRTLWSRRCRLVACASTEQPGHFTSRKMNQLSTGKPPLYCQVWANQIILLLSNIKQTRPARSPLGSEYLWICRTAPETETMVCSPEVFSLVTNCLLPLSDSKNQPWYFLGGAERSSLAITSCLVNKLSSKTVSCQELWSRGELTTPCSLDKTGWAL